MNIKLFNEVIDSGHDMLGLHSEQTWSTFSKTFSLMFVCGLVMISSHVALASGLCTWQRVEPLVFSLSHTHIDSIE